MVVEDDKPDRFAQGSGTMDIDQGDDEVMPGVTGGGRNYLPQSGQDNARPSDASSAEGTIGAVGEMDITGAPAGTSGVTGATGSGETVGGGPGGGATSRGGTGPRPGGTDLEGE